MSTSISTIAPYMPVSPTDHVRATVT
jgi:hypothetical protein